MYEPMSHTLTLARAVHWHALHLILCPKTSSWESSKYCNSYLFIQASLLWKVELLWRQKEYCGTISVQRRISSSPSEAWACTLQLLQLTLGAVEPVALCAPRNRTVYGVMLLGLLEVHKAVSIALAAVLTSRGPPLADGVTHWDDLVLLNSPYMVCGWDGAVPYLLCSAV